MKERKDNLEKKDWKNKLFYGNKPKIWYNIFEKLFNLFKRPGKKSEAEAEDELIAESADEVAVVTSEAQGVDEKETTIENSENAEETLEEETVEEESTEGESEAAVEEAGEETTEEDKVEEKEEVAEETEEESAEGESEEAVEEAGEESTEEDKGEVAEETEEESAEGESEETVEEAGEETTEEEKEVAEETEEETAEGESEEAVEEAGEETTEEEKEVAEETEEETEEGESEEAVEESGEESTEEEKEVAEETEEETEEGESEEAVEESGEESTEEEKEVAEETEEESAEGESEKTVETAPEESTDKKEEYINSVYEELLYMKQAYERQAERKKANKHKQNNQYTGGTSMGCDEFRVRWMFVRLREKRLNLLKPILPPESVMLNVAMQRGRWEDYGISMTINATSSGTPGHQMAAFFKDFIVVVDAGANEVEYYGSGKIEGVIPFASIKEYEVVTEKISEDYEQKYLLFTMKKDDQKFSFKLFEKRLYDDNYNYPWDYTPKTNGRDIKFYTDVVDKHMANAVDYGKKTIVVLKIMAEMKEGFHYDVFQNYVVDTEEHHWTYVLKFLREMKENGNKEYGAIYDQFKQRQQASYDLAIENNKKIKEIALQMKQVQEEIEKLEEEIPNLGFFARNLKGEKLNRLEELDGMEPGLVRKQNELKAEIERSHQEVEIIKNQTLDMLYKEIVTQEDYQTDLLERFLELNGHLNFQEIAILLDVFNWLEPEHTDTEAKKCLVPLIKKDVIILEDDRCYFKASLDKDRLAQIESKRDSSIEAMFAQSRNKIYAVLHQEVISRRVVRKQSLVQLINEEMLSHIGCLSDAFNAQIIDELIANGIMKDMNKVYVSLK